MSLNLRAAIRELYFWQRNPEANNFHALLYNLIAKADRENREALKRGFQSEVLAYEYWYNSPNPDLFFKQKLGDNFV